MFGLQVINAPFRGLVFTLGRPGAVLDPGVHFVTPFIASVVRVNCALTTLEVDIDVITKGGTPTQIKVGYTARVVDVRAAIVNVANPFATLRASVISVVSGAANNYTIDQLAQYKTQIANEAQAELKGLSEHNGWGLGDFQIAIGDPSMSEELKRMLMREEEVRRENAANIEKARNQMQVAQQLAQVAQILDGRPFAQELLRLQMISDMGVGGRVVVVDTKNPEAGAGIASMPQRH
jgi:hypothetical protein